MAKKSPGGKKNHRIHSRIEVHYCIFIPEKDYCNGSRDGRYCRYFGKSEILAKQGLTMEDALILFFEETVRLGRIPFEYSEEDFEEARRWEKMMNDDLCDV